jgi:hypothetical protein
VPRQRLRKGWGEERRAFNIGRREWERDCWTRVLRRSAGWRRMEEVSPERRPERKWYDAVGFG